MLSVRFFVLLLIVGFSSSCVIPVPHRREHVLGVKGKVLDSQTREVVAGAEIVVERGEDLVVTDEHGEFEVKPVYGWHGAYLLGPISYSILPHFDMPSLQAGYLVRAEGYEEKRFGGGGLVLISRKR